MWCVEKFACWCFCHLVIPLFVVIMSRIHTDNASIFIRRCDDDDDDDVIHGQQLQMETH